MWTTKNTSHFVAFYSAASEIAFQSCLSLSLPFLEMGGWWQSVNQPRSFAKGVRLIVTQKKISGKTIKKRLSCGCKSGPQNGNLDLNMMHQFHDPLRESVPNPSRVRSNLNLISADF